MPTKKESQSVTVELVGLEATAGLGELKILTYASLPEDHPFYNLVGRVASEWAHLEHALDQIIWRLMQSQVRASLRPNVLACVTSQIMGVGPRCKAIASLSVVSGLNMKDVIKPTRSLMSDSFSVADKRARIVHDPWFIERESQTPAQFRAMPYTDPKYGPTDITKDAINEIISEIRGLHQRALSLDQAVLAGLQASLKKQASA